MDAAWALGALDDLMLPSGMDQTMAGSLTGDPQRVAGPRRARPSSAQDWGGPAVSYGNAHGVGRATWLPEVGDARHY